MCHWLPQAQLQLSLIATGSITMCHYLPLAQPNLLLDVGIDHVLLSVWENQPRLDYLTPLLEKNIYGHIPFIRSHYILMI
jgi:hypothetical protein